MWPLPYSLIYDLILYYSVPSFTVLLLHSCLSVKKEKTIKIIPDSLSLYWVSQNVHSGFPKHLMEKPQWIFWPTQIFFAFDLSYVPHPHCQVFMWLTASCLLDVCSSIAFSWRNFSMKFPYNGNEPFMPLGSWRSMGKDVKIYTFVCLCVCVCVCVCVYLVRWAREEGEIMIDGTGEIVRSQIILDLTGQLTSLFFRSLHHSFM